MAIRRVVTGFAADGAPRVLFDGPAPAVLPPRSRRDPRRPLAFRRRAPDTTSTDDATARELALMPPGTLFRVIDLESGTPEPLWHTTASVDFVVSGEVTMMLGGTDGEVTEVELHAGETSSTAVRVTPG